MSNIDKIATDTWALYRAALSSVRVEWIRSSEKAYAFFLGNQLTKEEIATLREKKMPTFIINKMTPQIELMNYFLTARSPRWQVAGSDEADVDHSEIHAKVAQYVWEISKGQTVLSQIVRDALSKSIGYAKIVIDPDLDDGLGEVIVESEDPWNVIVDPHSRDPFFDDASYILVHKDFSLEKAESEFPGISREELLKLADDEREHTQFNWKSQVPIHNYDISSEDDSTGKMNQFIKYFELYKKVKIPHVNVFIEMEGEINNYIFEKKEYDRIIREDRKRNPEERIIEPFIINTVEFNRKKIKRTEILGTRVLEDVILPGTDYPIIPLPYRHVGTPYPMSVAMDLVGKQEEVNKAHQIVIHHANLSSVPRWLAEAGQIPSINNFEKNSSIPGSVLVYNPSSMGGTPPHEVHPQPLNNAFFTITTKGEADMEYISGMNNYMMGQGDRSGRETYRGLLAQDDFGTRRVRGYANNYLNPFLSRVGKVVDDYARFLYTTEKVFEIAHPDDPELIERHVINPVSPESAEKFFDDKQVRRNILFVGGSTLLVNRWAELEQMMELYEKAIVDKTSVLMKTDVGNKKALMERMDEIVQLSNSLRAAQEEIDTLSKNNEILERQIANARISVKVAEANIDINAEKEAFIYKLRKILQDSGNNAERARIQIEALINEMSNQTGEQEVSTN